MKFTRSEWWEIAMRGTSGDMVTDILSDWKEDRDKRAKDNRAQRWIPISERLPKIGERVLASLGNNYVAIACWFEMFSNHSDGHAMWKNDSGQEVHSVIAWMPLPEPLKEA